MHRSLLIVQALMLAAGLVTFPPCAAAGDTHTVIIEGMKFVPAALTLKAGDKVVWVNKDLFPHTATADGKQFDSGEIAAEATWSWIAGKPGAYPYRCTYHPTMLGTIRVE